MIPIGISCGSTEFGADLAKLFLWLLCRKTAFGFTSVTVTITRTQERTSTNGSMRSTVNGLMVSYSGAPCDFTGIFIGGLSVSVYNR